MNAREDASCPACPDPEAAFRIKDVGMQFTTDLHDGAMTFKASRPAWEVRMLHHLHSRLDDAEHRRIYDLCITELIAIEVSAEDLARDSVEAAADSVKTLLQNALRRTP